MAQLLIGFLVFGACLFVLSAYLEYVASKPGLANTDYESKYGCPVYAVYIKQKVDSDDTFFSNVTAGGFSAYVPAYELCKLEHLKQYGVRIDRL